MTRNSIVNIYFSVVSTKFPHENLKRHNTVFSDHKDNTFRIWCEVD